MAELLQFESKMKLWIFHFCDTEIWIIHCKCASLYLSESQQSWLYLLTIYHILCESGSVSVFKQILKGSYRYSGFLMLQKSNGSKNHGMVQTKWLIACCHGISYSLWKYHLKKVEIFYKSASSEKVWILLLLSK